MWAGRPLGLSTCPRGHNQKAEEPCCECWVRSAVHPRAGLAAAVGRRGCEARYGQTSHRLLALPNALISYDRFHVVAMANEAMDQVRQAEMRHDAPGVTRALGAADRKSIKRLMWHMRKNPSGWTRQQTNAMHWLQRSSLKGARAWRLKMALRGVYARAAASNDARLARADLNAWLSWAQRSRLESFTRVRQFPTLEHSRSQ